MLSGCVSSKISDEKNVFYAQVQSTGTEEIKLSGSNEIPLVRYKLTILNEQGVEKHLLLDSDTEIKKGAFLRIYYSDEQGVKKWEEVKGDEIPNKLRGKLEII
ncbi:hypothetical protein BK708_37155 [Bacillus thuringiensis serovar yunnanensis]|nr:hypothetical protein BK708_37155 [Bacillus thuringiensis serovar yunnanensis]